MNHSKHNLKVIFFDAGGVLFETFFDNDDRIRYLMRERGFPETTINSAIQKANEFRRTFFNQENWICNWEEEQNYWMRYFGIIAEELGDTKLKHELLLFSHFANHCELFPEVPEVLDVLSTKYRLGVISNALPSMDWVFERLGIRRYFQPDHYFGFC